MYGLTNDTNPETRRHFSIFTTSCNINNTLLTSNNSRQGNDNQTINNPIKSKLVLRPNSLFAFHNDDIYTNFCAGLNAADADIKTDLLSADLDCHSTFCSNKSNMMQCKMKNSYDKQSVEESNSCSISSDIENNFRFTEEITEPSELIPYQGMDQKTSEIPDSNKKRGNFEEQDIKNIGKQQLIKRHSDGSNEINCRIALVQAGMDQKANLEKRCSVGSDIVQKIEPGTFEIIMKQDQINPGTGNINDVNSPQSLENSVSNQSSCSPTISPSRINNCKSINNPSFRRNTAVDNPIKCPNFQINYLPPKRGSQNIVCTNFLCASNSNQNQMKNPPLISWQITQKNVQEYNQFNRGYQGSFLCMNTKTQDKSSSVVRNKNTAIASQAFPVFTNVQNNNNTINNNLQGIDEKYLFENLNNLLKEQNGCRVVQKQIEENCADQDFLKCFYEEIESFLIEVVNNQYGNYVMQKFYEIIQWDMNLVTRIFEKIKQSLYDISVNTYGTRFLQRALECMMTNYSQIETPALNEIFKEFIEKHMMDLIIDTNGNHVFQKILIIYPKSKNNFIFDELLKFAYDISKIKQGGCILQRAFDNANNQQRVFYLLLKIIKNMLAKKVLSYLEDLINDEYGNFIIQQIIFLKVKELNDYILQFLKKNLLQLSKKKFSSNVIDKCIINQNCGMQMELISHIINSRFVNELIDDPFGNYVIQKALQVSDGINFMAIIHQIKPALKTLKQTSYGRKIYEKLIMQYGDYFQPQSSVNYLNQNDRRKSHMYPTILKSSLGK